MLLYLIIQLLLAMWHWDDCDGKSHYPNYEAITCIIAPFILLTDYFVKCKIAKPLAEPWCFDITIQLKPTKRSLIFLYFTLSILLYYTLWNNCTSGPLFLGCVLASTCEWVVIEGRNDGHSTLLTWIHYMQFIILINLCKSL